MLAIGEFNAEKGEEKRWRKGVAKIGGERENVKKRGLSRD